MADRDKERAQKAREALFDIEGDLVRARDFAAGVRLLTEKAGGLDELAKGIVYLMACESEQAADRSIEVWERGLRDSRDHH